MNPTATLGRWTLVGKERLRARGRGGNGIVWEARTEGDDIHCALKIFTGGRFDLRERYSRFADEITFLTDHPDAGVLPLIDSTLAADPNDVSWYVMPLATPLVKALDGNGSIQTVLDVVATYAETLARLAALGIGHRDGDDDQPDAAPLPRSGPWRLSYIPRTGEIYASPPQQRPTQTSLATRHRIPRPR